MDALTTGLTYLHLPAMRTGWAEAAEVARKNDHTHEQYLTELVEAECAQRRQHRIERLLRASNLPVDKTLDQFDLKRLPGKLSGQVRVLLDGSFLSRSENVLAFGNPGSGKTHLLCAIGRELIVRHGKRVQFSTTSVLVQELLIAKRDLKLPRVLKRFGKLDALIIDDIGYVQQNREEMEVLFTLLADCYERTSILLTSNLPFSKWEQIFKDPMTTAAAIDRLVHHAVILELNLPSYRAQAAKKPRKKDGA
jgi:DNA replication protein DnaC